MGIRIKETGERTHDVIIQRKKNGKKLRGSRTIGIYDSNKTCEEIANIIKDCLEKVDI